MRNYNVWSGFDEYARLLRNLPRDCATEAAHMIESTANSVAVEIKTAYPYVTGNLRRGVVVERVYRRADGMIAGGDVVSGAPHAFLYEFGTHERSYTTENGVPHRTGAAKPGNVFAPRIDRARRQLTRDLKDMVMRHGASAVTGG